MVHVSDEEMRAGLQHTRAYSAVILKRGPNYGMDGMPAILWEHGRRNFELRADGLLSIVCPVADDSEVRGIGIFSVDEERTRSIMADDPGVKAGVFVFDVHLCRSFPGDSLPG